MIPYGKLLITAVIGAITIAGQNTLVSACGAPRRRVLRAARAVVVTWCMLMGGAIGSIQSSEIRSVQAQDIPEVVPSQPPHGFEISGTAYRDLATGISVLTDSSIELIKDQYLSRCYGVTLKEQDVDGYLHVGRCIGLGAGDELDELASIQSNYPGLSLTAREEIVASHKAWIVDGAPGVRETTYAYIPVGEHVFEIVFSGGQLLHEGKELIDRISLSSPSAPLPEHPTSEQSLRLRQPGGIQERHLWPQKSQRGEKISSLNDRPVLHATGPLGASPFSQPVYGCVSWPSWKGPRLQTPIAPDANGWGGSWAGESFYGNGLHQGCANPWRLNDYYALDFPLRHWDSILPAMWGPDAGTVLWVGWADGGWSELGRCVIVDLYDTFIASFCHLQSVAVWPGQRVSGSTILGWAGGSGNWTDTYWGPHLHMGIYHRANLDWGRGGVYGGYSTMPVWIRTFWPDTRYYPNGYYSEYQWRQWVSW